MKENNFFPCCVPLGKKENCEASGMMFPIHIEFSSNKLKNIELSPEY